MKFVSEEIGLIRWVNKKGRVVPLQIGCVWDIFAAWPAWIFGMEKPCIAHHVEIIRLASVICEPPNFAW